MISLMLGSPSYSLKSLAIVAGGMLVVFTGYLAGGDVYSFINLTT